MKEEYATYRKSYDSQMIVEYIKEFNMTYETYLKVENDKITLIKRVQGGEVVKIIDLGRVSDLLKD